MNWRKWNNILHRDIGYLSVGLIIIYSISGIAVNHVSDWNPNYIITKSNLKFNPILDSTLTTEQLVSIVTEDLNIEDSVQSSFRSSKSILKIFFEGKSVSADLQKGEAEVEMIKPRHIIKETNFLHLNNPKKIWTYVADIFAVALIFLAISGLFVLKGKKGFEGRGKWLMLLGFLIPIIFLIIYL
jgi:hypothetical protein